MRTSKNPDIIQIHRNTPHYPTRLLDLSDPPNSLYIYGDIHLLNLPMVAIVGSRAASPEGIRNAYSFAQALSAEGYLIISGLARGVDGAAHRGALRSNQGYRTIAVCGSGLDIVYPREHLDLARLTARGGPAGIAIARALVPADQSVGAR